MKLFATVLITAAGFASTNAVADVQFVGTDTSLETELCIAFASNKPHKLRKMIRNYRLMKQTMSDKLMCNDLSLEQFATVYGLSRTGNYLNLDVRTSTSIRDLAMV